MKITGVIYKQKNRVFMNASTIFEIMNGHTMKNIFKIFIFILLFTSCDKDIVNNGIMDGQININDLSFSRAFTNPMDSTAFPDDLVRIILYSDGAEPDIIEDDQCFYREGRMGNVLILGFTGNMHGDTIKDGLYVFNESNLPDDSEYAFNFFQIRLGDPIIPGQITTGGKKLNGEIAITTDQNLKKMEFDLTLGEYTIKGNFEGPILFCW